MKSRSIKPQIKNDCQYLELAIFSEQAWSITDNLLFGFTVLLEQEGE